MAGKSKAVGQEIAEKARAALQATGKTGEVAKRLTAIIAAETNTITHVAQIFQVTRTTLMSWIKKFTSDAEKGLSIQPGRGRKRMISPEIVDDIQQFVKNDPNTTIVATQQYVKEKHGIDAARMTIYRILKRLRLSHITPRPRHVKADQKAQEAFKKKSSEPRSRKST